MYKEMIQDATCRMIGLGIDTGEAYEIRSSSHEEFDASEMGQKASQLEYILPQQLSP